MRSPTLIGPILGLSFCAAFADIPVSIPAVADISTTYGVGVDSTSPNALKIKALTGATYYTGKSTSASLTETAQGELVLKWSAVYDPADGDYGTSVGLLLPLTPDWDIKDLSLVPEIDYEIMADAAVPANSAHLQIGSYAYGPDAVKSNAALAQPKWTTLTTTYQSVKILTSALSMNDWYSGPEAATTGWSDPTLTYSIGKAVKNLNFQPQIGWASATVMKSGMSGTIRIRNVVVKGIECYCMPLGTGCTGTYTLVDDFAATNPNTGAVRSASDPNYLGGAWYAFSDTSSDPARSNDTALGKSRILLSSGAAKWLPLVGTAAIATAQLEKNDTGSDFLYHKQAGWADIGTDLPGPNPDGSLALPSLTAVSFDLYAGAALESVVPGASFDTARVRRIIFKVSKTSVGEAQAYSVDIPAYMALSTTSNNFCVDVSMLHQPGWYVKDKLAGKAVPFAPDDLSKLSWEIKIEDQADSTIHSTSVPSTFGVTNVKLYGVDPTGIRAGRGPASTALRAGYSSALHLTYRVDGPFARIEVRSLDGARIASFQEAATVQNLSLPVALARGTYVVTVQGAKTRQVAILSVAR